MNETKNALDYHRFSKPGKIEVIPSKPCLTQSDLSLAYTPGVAVPCLEIQRQPERSFDYTTRGNLVGVITNGTAVLGLGNIGPLAGKPVMEGKAVLFKRFADLDVFDIEINTEDPDEFVQAVKLLEPTFGGINLEDIKAPECFYIEERLKKEMGIPVFHDDQHGTAIISAAGLINACELVGKQISALRMVINGAGAAAMACGKMYMQLGVARENIIFVDSKGVIYQGRPGKMGPYKQAVANATELRTLETAVAGADVLVGLSVKGVFTPAMLQTMAARPIIFALANPDPEIDYEAAKAARPDAIVATGRSDYPNQINNVLGFPFIFRGALDVRATTINDEMKIAAARAIAKVAREDVPDSVMRAYGGKTFRFGPDYIVPTPLDHRVLLRVTPAVAEAAVKSGVARVPQVDRKAYVQMLEAKLGPEREIMRKLINQARQNPKKIVLPEGYHPTILRAAAHVAKSGIAKPVLLCRHADEIASQAKALHIPVDQIEHVEIGDTALAEQLAQKYYQRRARKGCTMTEARRQLKNRYVFGAMMVEEGLVDGQVHGVDCNYPDAIRPVLQVIPRMDGIHKVSGAYLMIFRDQNLILADTTVNIQPDAECLAEIAMLAAEKARFFEMTPRVAMISFSNFGSTRHPDAQRVRQAVEIVKACHPDLAIDGEMQADTAVTESILTQVYPFNTLGGPANVLVFPELAAANITFKLLERLGGAKAVGPLLMGLSKPFNVLVRGADMENVIHVIAITTVQSQEMITGHTCAVG